MRIVTFYFVATVAVIALLAIIGIQQTQERQHCRDIHGNWHYDVLRKTYKCN